MHILYIIALDPFNILAKASSFRLHTKNTTIWQLLLSGGNVCVFGLRPNQNTMSKIIIDFKNCDELLKSEKQKALKE